MDVKVAPGARLLTPAVNAKLTAMMNPPRYWLRLALGLLCLTGLVACDKNPTAPPPESTTSPQSTPAAPNAGDLDPVRSVYAYGFDEAPDARWQKELVDHLQTNIRWNLSSHRADLRDMVRLPSITVPLGTSGVALRDDQHLPAGTHRVPAFYLDRYETSNAQYNECVAAKQCLPIEKMPIIRDHWLPDHPALLSYKQAERYCLWRGKRLPGEFEWERAARGAQGATYPWGEEPPTGKRANLCGAQCEMDWATADWNDGYPYSAPVTALAAGDTASGLRHMCGNVKEWVTTAESLPAHHYVARGSSWYSGLAEAPSYYRQIWHAGVRLDDKGVRCAVTAR
ncbi:MAG: SUMF1/EgtB/PvdO family nonheme iron enzyme [Candidatus Lernaella stagnicola]|nr:SUMF1/EgtB/PvdO family nonheme iron enzyme [Candidatus Lernaella stagnicola]